MKLIWSERWKCFKTWEISDWRNKILGAIVHLACFCCWNLSWRELCLHWMIQREIIGFWPCNEFCMGSLLFGQMGYIRVAISCFIVVINGSFFNSLCSWNTIIFIMLQWDLQAAIEMNKTTQMIVQLKEDFNNIHFGLFKIVFNFAIFLSTVQLLFP